ncbi:MAG TPA: HAD-IIIA family hydrolase [Opitutaceae bacterium]|nr:HAD-IIIA family hydrolase [Opitutaceae bacterium]
MKALFLDRDGTLIVDKHYLADPAGVELLPGVVEGLRRARDLGYKLFLFSNQSGIGRGYFTMDAALAVNRRMEELIGLGQPLFTGVCLAPESPDQPPEYRKPSPRFILEMIATHRLDPAQCTMVGDRETDIEAGLNAKIHVAGLCNGKLDTNGWAKFGFKDLPLFSDFSHFAAALT